MVCNLAYAAPFLPVFRSLRRIFRLLVPHCPTQAGVLTQGLGGTYVLVGVDRLELSTSWSQKTMNSPNDKPVKPYAVSILPRRGLYYKVFPGIIEHQGESK